MEHSAVPLTCIKVPLLSTYEWPLKTDFTVLAYFACVWLVLQTALLWEYKLKSILSSACALVYTLALTLLSPSVVC